MFNVEMTLTLLFFLFPGFPEQIPYKYFRCRFQCLLKEQNISSEYMDDRAISGKILEELGAFSHRYRLGLSQVIKDFSRIFVLTLVL